MGARGQVAHLDVPGQEVNGSMVIGSMGYFTDPYKWGMNWGYNLLTNLLLTSWDIQVLSLKLTANAPARLRHPKRKRPRLPTIHFQVDIKSQFLFPSNIQQDPLNGPLTLSI